MNQKTSLTEALANYKRSEYIDFLQAADEQRQEMVGIFPIAKWPTMALEDYVLGLQNKKDTYCYMLEYKAVNLGSLHGQRSKGRLVYKRKDGWYFEPQYRDENEAWSSIRNAIVEALKLAGNGQIDQVDDLDVLKGMSAAKLKTLHLYFPDEIIPIYAKGHIVEYLKRLGDSNVPSSYENQPVKLNRRLLNLLMTIPEMQGWSTVEMMRFLYEWADPRENERVLKIAPGENAKYWPDCLAGGYICVGWDEVGDLREFENKEDYIISFTEEYRDEYKDKASMIKRKANELWKLMELEPGDIVVANKGISKVLGVGKVVDPGYQWMPERDQLKHVVKVEWDTSLEQTIPDQKSWPFVTVANIKSDLYSLILKKSKSNQLQPVIVPPMFKEILMALENKKQVILYGPPGTGKTHQARQFAVWWSLKGQNPAIADQVIIDPIKFREEEERLSNTFIMRVTFHPSYSYEDFVEGFRPVDNGSGQLFFKLESGLFKRLCREAAANPNKNYLLLIDEINRANVAKVLGELITLLEADKRGLTVTLPQSKENFAIPQNVFIIATMNTADRSIKLLDAAIRRRFAFLEIMPDVEILLGAEINGLKLDDFLDGLNARISRRDGREKQIGHSYLMERGEALSDLEEFARRFRHEILPLLQEMCYDDYRNLAEYLGEKLIDKELQRIDNDILTDPESLVAVLAKEFNTGGNQV